MPFTGCLRAYRFHFTSLSRALCFRNLPALVPLATWSFYQWKRLKLSKPSDRVHWPALWKALFEQGFLQHLISIYKGGYCGQPGEIVDDFGQSEQFRIRRCATRLRSQSTFISCCFRICYAKMDACRWTRWYRFDGCRP